MLKTTTRQNLGNASYLGATGSLPLVIAKSAIAVSTPADVTEDILATVTIPANAMGINGRVRIMCSFTFNNNANSKTLRVRFGGIGGTILYGPARSTTLASSYFLEHANRGVANSQVSSVALEMATTGAVTGGNVITSAIDTTASTTIVFTGQKAVAGDTLTLESYMVELIPG